MRGQFLRRWLPARRPAHDEREGNEAGDDQGEPPERILVTQHLRLAVQRLPGIPDGKLFCGIGALPQPLERLPGRVNEARILQAAGDGMGAEAGNMGLAGSLKKCGEQGRAHRSADIAGKVGEAGNLIVLVAGNAQVVEGADGDEDEGQPHDLVSAPHR